MDDREKAPLPGPNENIDGQNPTEVNLEPSNTDTEQESIKQNCEYIKSFLNELNQADLSKMSSELKRDIISIQDKLVVFKLKKEKTDEKQVLSESTDTEESDDSSSESDKSTRSTSKKNRRKSENSMLKKIADKLDNRKIPNQEKFDENSGESLKEYMLKFESYCKANIKGSKRFWISELGEHLDKETLKAFKAIRGVNDEYSEVKKKLLEWYTDMKDIRKKRYRDQFNKIRQEKDESLYMLSSRLEKYYRLAYPKHEIEKSDLLAEKYMDTVPRKFKKQLSSQMLSSKMRNKKIVWSEIQRFARYKDAEMWKEKRQPSDEEKEIIINIEHTEEDERRSRTERRERKLSTLQYQQQDRDGPSYNNQQKDFQYREKPSYQKKYNNESYSNYQSYPRKFQSFRPPALMRCAYCNRIGHKIDTCYAKLRKCFICGKEGHFMMDCYQKDRFDNSRMSESRFADQRRPRPLQRSSSYSGRDRMNFQHGSQQAQNRSFSQNRQNANRDGSRRRQNDRQNDNVNGRQNDNDTEFKSRKPLN